MDGAGNFGRRQKGETMKKHLLALSALLFVASTGYAQQPPPPACENDPKYNEFDFWLGEWDVFMAGNKIGENIITKEERGCLVLEKWTDVNGGTGQSYNYYNPDSDEWRQVWVSSYMLIDYVGNLNDDGAMELVGEVTTFHDAKTAKFLGRWTLLEDGTVEQYFEQYSEEQQKMVPIFTGIYHRKDDSE